mgnify:CR=1 FL=1
MKIIGQLIIGIVGMMISILMAYGFSFFTEKVDYSYQKAIDNISYDRLKKVEDTARAMIATYKSDKLTYEAYKNTDVELATQAKIRANKTAVTYNEYILKNSFQWQGNIPSDIYNQLEIIEWGEIMATQEQRIVLKEIEDLKNETLYTVYNILTKCLGEIPETFTYEYRDKDEKFHRISNITPKEFFDKYVGWNLKDKISLINAPTDDKPYGKVYTVKFLGTIKEADKIKYVNVPIEVLKESAIKSIKAGEPVWFGCDVIKFLEKQKGIMDLDMFIYDDIFPTLENFTKAERLDYHESVLTHAMVFTGVNLDENGKPLEWQVENSWGDAVGDKGIFSMTDEWFDEYNYEVMVDKKYVDEKWLNALDEKTIELEPWDPFGALARLK